MRLLHTALLFLLLPVFATANYISEFERQNFINSYVYLAVQEMQRSGVPASITMAQAILESNWGKGITAVNGNNYFCIKCNNGWEGDTINVWDDEAKQSCFRVYPDVVESFKDHSDFLMKNKRYQKLFQHGVTDYVNWAKSLKECGYATDEWYAEKLIGLIEGYGLYIYDNASPASFQMLSTPHEMPGEEDLSGDIFQQEELPLQAATTESFESPFAGFYEEKESQQPVMTAPVWRYESNTPVSGERKTEIEIQAAAPDEPFAPEPGQAKPKIRPIMPVPVLGLERRE